MKKVLFIVLLIFFSSNNLIAQQKIITHLGYQEMKSFLDNNNYEYTHSFDDLFQIKYEGVQFNFSVLEKGRVIILRRFFRRPDFPLKNINDFNSENKWAKVYINNRGNLTVGQDFILTGGITEKTLVNIINNYAETLMKFQREFPEL